MSRTRLSPIRAAFAAEYRGPGDETRAAEAAGYVGSGRVLRTRAGECLRDPRVVEALHERWLRYGCERACGATPAAAAIGAGYPAEAGRELDAVPEVRRVMAAALRVATAEAQEDVDDVSAVVEALGDARRAEAAAADLGASVDDARRYMGELHALLSDDLEVWHARRRELAGEP